MSEEASLAREPKEMEGAAVQGEHIALRDMHINYNDIKPEFASIDVGKYKIPHYTPPKFVSAAVNQIQTERIAIISGGRGFDKGSLLKHLSSLILDSNPSHSVKELRKNHEVIPVLDKMDNQGAPTIIILKSVHPGLIEYDLEKLRRICDSKNHFVIISTDVVEQSWHLTTTQKAMYWFEVPLNSLYHPESLSSLLVERLGLLGQNVPNLKIPKELRSDSDLTDSTTVKDVAIRLESPEKIHLFVRLLSKKQESLSEEIIEDIFKVLSSEGDTIISQWFLSLNRKEKLIAIGAALLDGMMDDQFFASMQILIKDFWEHTEQSLLALDYQDIEFLMGYFELDNHSGVKILKSKYPNQQAEIIKAAWKTHRRHIMSAMPKLISLIYESMNPNERDWEKYGNQNRRLTLRDSISQTISDVGLVSTNSVDSILLELACWADAPKQRVAAKAVARWREFGRDDLLFETIDRWINSETIQADIDQFKDGKRFEHRQRFGKTTVEYVKATAVLSLGYASLYDSPNELSQGIIDRFLIIASDTDKRVKSSVQAAIPRLIHHHILQLKDVIANELVKHDDLDAAIGKGIADALIDYPVELKNTLDQWLDACLATESQENRRNKLTYRDKVLAVWMRTYQQLDYKVIDPNVISRDDVLKQLTKLAQVEKRNDIRHRVFQVGTTLIMHDSQANSKHISNLFYYSNNSEKQYLLNRLEAQYINERLNLQGGNYLLKLEVGTIPVWFPASSRPRTTVETIMCTWLESEDETLQKIASLAYAGFATVIDTKERFAEKVTVQQLDQPSTSVSMASQERRNPSHPQQVYRPRTLSLWNRIVVFLLFFGESRDKKELFKSILTFLKEHKEYNSTLWLYVLKGWKESNSQIQRTLGTKLSFFKLGSFAPTTSSDKKQVI